MTKFSKVIGIVGGAGPMASAFLYTAILQVCQTRYGANDYADFPEIALISYPFSRGSEKKIKQEIEHCLTKLTKLEASLFCIASHSFHVFLPKKLPHAFVDLVKEGVQEAKRCGISKALILAAETTIRLKLYEEQGIVCVYPPNSYQTEINLIIREVAGGKIALKQYKNLTEMIACLKSQLKFDGIIIA